MSKNGENINTERSEDYDNGIIQFMYKCSESSYF